MDMNKTTPGCHGRSPMDRPWEVLPVCFWNNFEAGFLSSDQNLFVTFQKNRRLVHRDPQNGLLKPYNLYITVYRKIPCLTFNQPRVLITAYLVDSVRNHFSGFGIERFMRMYLYINRTCLHLLGLVLALFSPFFWFLPRKIFENQNQNQPTLGSTKSTGMDFWFRKMKIMGNMESMEPPWFIFQLPWFFFGKKLLTIDSWMTFLRMVGGVVWDFIGRTTHCWG